MAQTRAALRRINGRGNPRSRIITPAMLDAGKHRRNQTFRMETYNSSNSTHKT
jgi:hypothetical protein